MAHISCSVYIYYPQSISFIEFLMDLCIYDDILDAIWIVDKSYCILNSQIQVKLYVQIRPVFPSPVTYRQSSMSLNSYLSSYVDEQCLSCLVTIYCLNWYSALLSLISLFLYNVIMFTHACSYITQQLCMQIATYTYS